MQALVCDVIWASANSSKMKLWGERRLRPHGARAVLREPRGQRLPAFSSLSNKLGALGAATRR